MFKTVSEAMTAITDELRAKTYELEGFQGEVTRKYKLSEIPGVIDEVCNGLRQLGFDDGIITGHNQGHTAGFAAANNQISQKLDTTVQIAKENGAEGDAGSNVDTKISFLNTNIPEIYKSGEGDFEDKVLNLTQRSVDRINSYLDTPEEAGNTAMKQLAFIYNKIPKIYENGMSEGEKDWWLRFQQLKEEKGYQYAFRNTSWVDDIYNPVIDIVAISGLNHNEMFRNSLITDTIVPIYFKHSGATLVFNGSALSTIVLLDVVENVTYDRWFGACDNLENITMSGTIGNDIDFKDCKKLTRASIENIISVLSDTAEGKTATFSLEAVNNAFTDTEWNTLAATKPNWTIKTT